MNLKKKLTPYRRVFTYAPVRWAFRLAAAIARRVPAETLVSFFERTSCVAHACLWRHRRQMARNVRLAFGGELGQDGKVDAIVRGVFRNIQRGAAELVSAMYWTPEAKRSRIVIEGKENLDSAIAKGRGVIALSAHLGNFTLIGARLAVDGYKFHALIKNPPDKGLADLLTQARENLGQKTISARPAVEAAKNILRALRRNEIVLMVVDEYKHKGIMVNFLGRPAPSARGPATLALRSGAAVVPMFGLWEENRLRLVIEPALCLVDTGQTQSDVRANTALFAQCLERVIRRYPDQWNWLNVRWGTRKSTDRAGSQAISS
jgi:KDO2-lipid IV(A) lauroyltransferase